MRHAGHAPSDGWITPIRVALCLLSLPPGYLGVTCQFSPHAFQIKNMTVDVKGWVWTDEGRRKWGWVANSTGATLDIKVPAVVPHESMRNKEGNATLVGCGKGKGGRWVA